MTYETFLTEISDHVRHQLPTSTEVVLRKVQKNNNQIFDGLVISDHSSNVSPTIYVNHFYPQLEDQTLSMDSITSIILDQYRHARMESSFDLSDFSNFNEMKDRIIFRIINREQNANLLKDIPHIEYLDLAITFLCLMSVHSHADATILIHHNHAAIWQTDVDTLFTLAKKNTPRLLAWDMTSMQDILSEMTPPDDDLIPSKDDVAYPMYVLTNRIKLHGAACILYDNLLSSLSKKFNDDFYIIPSSVHEVLLIPQSVTASKEELDSMIREVNATQVPDEDILSDHAYLYLRDQNKIVY